MKLVIIIGVAMLLMGEISNANPIANFVMLLLRSGGKWLVQKAPATVAKSAIYGGGMYVGTSLGSEHGTEIKEIVQYQDKPPGTQYQVFDVPRYLVPGELDIPEGRNPTMQEIAASLNRYISGIMKERQMEKEEQKKRDKIREDEREDELKRRREDEMRHREAIAAHHDLKSDFERFKKEVATVVATTAPSAKLNVDADYKEEVVYGGLFVVCASFVWAIIKIIQMKLNHLC